MINMYFYMWREDSQDEISEMLDSTELKMEVELKGIICIVEDCRLEDDSVTLLMSLIY